MNFISILFFFTSILAVVAIEDEITSDVPGKNPKLIELTFVADESLTSRGFKCTSDWCQTYCKQKSANRKFTSFCDETESCHCKFEPPPGFLTSNTKTVKLIAPSNKTAGVHAKHIANMTKAECTQEWCIDYCQIKSNGRKFNGKCDSPLSCVCEFQRQPITTDENVKNGEPKMTRKTAKCTQEFCSNFCESKSDGREFKAVCDDSEACKCHFTWRKTVTSFMASAGPM
uniref:Uncharacterized protein n=1 Tax=Panagrolaimus davidi TaxID=227884 RepID=A0A914QRH3_9BILA